MKKFSEYLREQAEEHKHKKAQFMSNTTQFDIVESTGDPIDDAWLDNSKPVQTADGRQAIVTNIDMSNVPNIIKGQVKIGNHLFDYEWEDDGTCIKPTDPHPNPKKPEENDNLVKA